MRAPFCSGSRAKTEQATPSARGGSALEQEWLAAAATDRREAEQAARARTQRALGVVVPAGLVAALLPAIFPLTPGFSASQTMAAVVAA